MEEQVQKRKIAKRSPWIAGNLTLIGLGSLVALLYLPGASLLERLRWLDSGICAQVLTHTFYEAGERLPLCARNTGIYLGFIVTLITLYATGRGRVQRLPPWPIIAVLIGGIFVLAIDGFNSFLLDLGQPHLYQPQNLLRLATGLVAGLAMGLLILPMLNRLVWCSYDERRSVSSWKRLALFVPGLIICLSAVVSSSSITLYPIALFSTLGIVTAISSANLIIVVSIVKREQSFAYYREFLPLLTIAYICAIGEMLALAQLKLLLMQALHV